MGVPALATNVSGIPEILEHEKTGLVVPPSDPEIMAKNILRLLTDTELRKTCISNGQKVVRAGFNNYDWTVKLAETYRQETACH